jgi:tetratricopeptide (TPR) repeat protein
VTADPISPSNTDAGPAAAASARESAPFWKSAVKLLCPVLCLFQGTFLLSWLLLSRLATDGPRPEAVPAAHEVKSAPTPSAEPAPEKAEAEDLRLADAELQQGNYARALARYRPGPPSRRPMPAQMQFRVGLCLEGLGKWDEALAAYRDLVAGAPAPHLLTAGQVAQARVWARRGQPGEVQELLSPVLLIAGDGRRCPPALAAEARYLLGLSLGRQAFPERRPPRGQEPLVRTDAGQWPLAHSLAWLGPDDAPRAGAKPLPGTLQLMPAGEAPPEMAPVRGAAEHLAVEEAVAVMANLARLRLEWSPAAAQAVRGRTAALALDGIPLLDVVRALAGPLGLTAACKDDVLRVCAETELSSEERAARQAAAARDALRAAVVAHPDHPLAGAACLELGNDEAAAGRLAEAAAWYGKLLGLKERPALVVAAHFNLGLVRIVQKNYEEARRSFFRAVDRNPGHPLAPRAYVQIGCSHLLEGNPAEGLVPLGRALNLAAGGPARPEAATFLAAAHLLNGAPRQAHAVLLANRDALNRAPVRPTAAFLDALALYRAAGQQKQSRLEAADLVAALVAAEGQKTLGVVGLLLRGQAYRDLGLADAMARVFAEGVGRCDGPLADEMTFALAEHRCETGLRLEATKMLQGLAAQGAGRWGAAAQTRLAAIALSEDRPQDCLQRCRALLSQGPPTDRGAILQLMGRAYEKLENPALAARCYAGQSPE